MLQLRKKKRHLIAILLVLTAFVSLLAGGSVASSATVDTVYALGENNYGQFGNGLTTTNGQNTPLLTGISGVSKLTVVYNQGFAVTTDNRLLSWGYNADGQLGLGTNDQNPHPTPAYVVGATPADPYLTGVIDVAGASQYTLALKSDGTVWGWGYNGFGQLGQGFANGTLILRPTQVMGLNGVKVVAIAAGFEAGYALSQDGTLYGWGYNISGILGTGDYTPHYTATRINFTNSASPVSIKTISTMYNHVLAIDTNNNLWAWGINDNGQIGNGTNSYAITPVKVLQNVQAIAAGQLFSLAATSDGKVYAWGNDTYYQLGDNNPNRPAKNTPQVINGLTGVIKLAAGNDFALALTSDNSVYGWGNSYFGQVGPHLDPYDYTIHSPQKITGLTGVQNISAGQSHTLITTAPLAPAVQLQPTSLDFGQQSLNTVSAAKTVTLTNTGNSPLTVNAISLTGTNPADFTAKTATSLPATVNAGSNLTIEVTFKPTVAGNRSANLTVASDAPGSSPSVSLIGSGLAVPQIQLNPATLNFADQTINTTSTAQNVVVSNTGTADLHISKLDISGANASDFSYSNATLPLTVAPGSTASVAVTFKPSATGTRSATLNITDDAAGSPHSVSLSGNGLAAPKIQLNPYVTDFGTQVVKTTSTAKTIVISNIGAGPLTISAINLSGANASDFKLTYATLPITVAPNSSINIDVTFTPTAPVARTAGIDVTDNSPGSPHSVPVRGTGVATNILSANPATLAFGKVANNTQVIQSATLTNISDSTVQISNVVNTGSDNFVSYLRNGDSSHSATLKKGQSIELVVIFKAAKAGVINTTFLISGSDGNLIEIPVTAEVVANPLQANVTSVDFGKVLKLTTSSKKEVVITNITDHPVKIVDVGRNGLDGGFIKALFKNSPQNPTLEKGASLTIELTFSAGIPIRANTASISIRDAGGNSLEIAIKAETVAQGLQANPTSINFGKLALSTTSSEKKVTVTNITDNPVEIQNLDLLQSQPFYFKMYGGQGSQRALLEPGQSVTIGVTFSEIRPRIYSDTLRLSNAYFTLLDIPMQVEVVATALKANPASIDFGKVVISTTSQQKSVTLTNTTDYPVEIKYLSEGFNTTGITAWLIGGQASSKALVAPGESVNLVATYKAIETLGVHVGTLEVKNAQDYHLVTILLNMEVIATPVQADVTSLDFGNQLVDTPSQPKTITLTNYSTSSVQISKITIEGSSQLTAGSFSYTSSQSIPLTLAPGQSITLTVTFKPILAKTITATLVVYGANNTKLATVNLKGYGLMD